MTTPRSERTTETHRDSDTAARQQDPTVDPLDTSQGMEGDPVALPGLDDNALDHADATGRPSTSADGPDRSDRSDRERLSTSDLANRGQQTPADDGRDATPDRDDAPPLVSDPNSYLDRWQSVQAGFVDEPRSAVQEADALVAEVIQRIAEGFAQERDSLEKQWSGGENVDTEQLRIALQRYRSFFTRLLQT